MRRFIGLLIALVVVGCFGFWAATNTNQKIKREPLQKSGTILKSPVRYEKRAGIESGKEVAYDPKPRVELVDARAGKYEFKWIGYDGKEKVIAYQRADAIDAVVSGSVEKSFTFRFSSCKIFQTTPSPLRLMVSPLDLRTCDY